MLARRAGGYDKGILGQAGQTRRQDRRRRTAGSKQVVSQALLHIPPVFLFPSLLLVFSSEVLKWKRGSCQVCGGDEGGSHLFGG